MKTPFRKHRQQAPPDPLRDAIGDLELPSFPGVILDALEKIREPDVSASAVADALAPDPGATIKLLRLVNSAAYGPSKPVTSVSQAVAIAGLGTVESMLLAIGVNVALPNVDVEGLDQKRFWRAAAHRGAVAKTFANELHPATAGISFTSGLLLDMAVPLLAVERADYRPLLREWHGGGADLHDLEHRRFGWSHDEIAARMCEEWELPTALREAIGGHHGSSTYEAPPAVVLSAPFREVQDDDVHDMVVSMAHESYNVEPDKTVALLEQAESDATEIAQLFT
ncbi:MAG: HDOD domain-containing protein [Acidimicrobiia bacterium]|nr:HDOD domain-containing protein [Acidimicrobiia bacterium]